MKPTDKSITKQGEFWTRDTTNQVRLLASLELDSGIHLFPPIPAQSPLADRFRVVALSPTASIFSFTEIHPNPKSGKSPFVLIYADFPELVRVLGRLRMTHPARPVIGDSVCVDIEDGGENGPQYVFVPARARGL